MWHIFEQYVFSGAGASQIHSRVLVNGVSRDQWSQPGVSKNTGSSFLRVARYSLGTARRSINESATTHLGDLPESIHPVADPAWQAFA
jgi:hypothetical protein